jgi:hypothetical protein
MNTKYAGSCKVCGSLWKEGEEIFYQKEPKAICSDETCYTEQGGKKFVPQGKTDGGNNSQTTLTGVEQKMNNAGALDAQLANIAYSRLKDVEAKLGEIAVPEKLIFLESWARTIAMSLR